MQDLLNRLEDLKTNNKHELNNLKQMASFSLELYDLGKYKDRDLKGIYQHICSKLPQVEEAKVNKLRKIIRS